MAAPPQGTDRPTSDSTKNNLFQPFLYGTIRVIVGSLLRLGFGLRVHGRENVPKTGPVLLVANHQSYLDPPVVSTSITCRQTQFLARAGLFENRLFSLWITMLNSVPVGEGDSETAAIREILRRLGDDKSVLIFPEGSRTMNGAMEEFKRGVAVLLKRAKCVTVPLAIEGSFDAWPRERKLPKMFGTKLEVKFGEPIGYDELMKDGPQAALDRLAREIDAMRLGLRATLRSRTNCKFPPPGPGDELAHTVESDSN